VARGIIYAAHNNYAEARAALATAVTLGARSPEALAHLADSILHSEPAATSEAQSAIQRALRLAPGDPWMLDLAAQIDKKPADKMEAPDPRRLFQSRPPKEW